MRSYWHETATDQAQLVDAEMQGSGVITALSGDRRKAARSLGDGKTEFVLAYKHGLVKGQVAFDLFRIAADGDEANSDRQTGIVPGEEVLVGIASGLAVAQYSDLALAETCRRVGPAVQAGLDYDPFGRQLRIALAFIGSEFDYVVQAFLLDSLVELALHELPELGGPAPGHLVFVSLSPFGDIPDGALESCVRFLQNLTGEPFLRSEIGNPALQFLDGGFALS